MKYPSLGRNRSYRVSIPQLNGGVNYAVPPHSIDDNQLSDVNNMWFKDGILQTRPAISGRDCKEMPGGSSYISCTKARDKYCVLSSAHPDSETASLIFSFVDQNGKFVSESTLDVDIADFNASCPAFTIENTKTLSVGEETYDDMEIIAFVNGCYKIYGVSSKNGCKEIQPYAPLLLMNGVPQYGAGYIVTGDALEPYNLLTKSFRCQFTSTEDGRYYYVPVKESHLNFKEVRFTYINSNNETIMHVALLNEGRGWLLEDEENPADTYVLKYHPRSGLIYLVDREGEDVVLGKSGIDNDVEITVIRNEKRFKSKIFGMKLHSWYGGSSEGLGGGTRLFVTGNEEEPNLIHWSATENPLYFPENNYTYVGDNNTGITALAKQSELLVIFKENELFCTQHLQGYSATAEDIQNQTVVDIEAARAVFPLFQLHPDLGCDCPNTIQLCNNHLVWLNSDGNVYGLFSTGIYNEKNVRSLSFAVEEKLKKKTQRELKHASAAELRNHYLLFVGEDVLVMDYSSNGFLYYGSYSSDEKARRAIAWYVWDIQQKYFGCQNFFSTYNNIIMIGQTGQRSLATCSFDFDSGADDMSDAVPEYDFENGTYSETPSWYEKALPIPSSFKTKQFDFGYPERLKRLNCFYLQISGEEGKTLNLTYLRGNGDTADAYSPVLTGSGLEMTAPIRISANAMRVREFGLGISCNGRMAVESLVLNYSMMGTVR